MKVVAFTGHSGAGKSTAITALIEMYVARGLRVGAIKHTHHPLNEEDRGDTAKFRRAGAEPVILAGLDEAVVFARDHTKRVRFSDPRELLAHFDADIVLVEGWKSLDVWPRVELNRDEHYSTQQLAELVDRILGP